MSEVKWIKFYVSILTNKKIKRIRRMPDGDTIALIWAFLLAQAGESNKDGAIYFNDEIPYSAEEFAQDYDFKIDTVRLAITTFEKLGMIGVFDGIVYIKNWDKYQSTDSMDKLREQNRIRQAAFKERKKIEQSNVTVTLPVTLGNATEEDIEEEIDKEIDKRKIVDYQQIADMYNDTCVSFPKLTNLSDKRKKAVKARLKQYVLDDFQKLFTVAEQSDFLKGKNNRNWSATFDWLIADSNMAKVLDGNYKNGSQNQQEIKSKSNNKFNQFPQREYTESDMVSMEQRLLEMR